MNKLLPEISAWYQDVVNGSLFEVVAIDEASGTIEYQTVDGEVGEYDSTVWRQLYLVPAEAPEDWSSPYGLSSDDLAYSDQVQVPENFSGVLSDIEPNILDPGDDFHIL